MTSSNSPRPRWKWRRWLALALVLLLVWLAPALVALTLRNWLAGRVLADLKGSVHIGGASVGWFSPPVLENVELRDEAGQPLLTTPRIEGRKSLLALLWDHADVGAFRIERPTLHIACGEQDTNLERAFAHWLQPGEKPDSEPSLAGIGLQLEIVEASLQLHDEPTDRRWAIEPVDVSLTLPRDRRNPLQLTLHGAIETDLSMQYVERQGAAPALKGQATVGGEALSLAMLAPFLRRVEPAATLDGRLSVQLTAHWDETNASGRLEGQVAARDLAVAGPWLGKDRLHLKQLKLPCRVAMANGEVTVEQAEFQCDAGSASVIGRFDPRKDFESLLRQPGLQAALQVDLAKLAALLPHTLHLQQDMRITSGQLTGKIGSAARTEGVVWEGTLNTSDIQAMHQGQPIAWREPLSLAFAARPVAGGLPVLEKLRCDADFLHLEGSGSVESLTITANYDLSRLAEQLSRFLDLGTLRPSGKGWSRVTAQQDKQGNFRLETETQVKQLRLGGAQGRTWQEESVILRLDAVGQAGIDRPLRVNSGSARVQLSADEATLTLLEPITDLRSGLYGKVQLRLRGDLARWQQRARPWAELPADWQLTGPADLIANVRSSAQAVDADNVKLSLRDLRFRGLGLTVIEPSLEVQTTARWQAEAGRIELKETHLTCATLALHLPTLALTPDAKGGLAMGGNGTVQGDVARLQRWLQDPPPALDESLRGALGGRISVQTAGTAMTADLDLVVQNIALGAPSAPSWQEPRVQLFARACYDSAGDAVQVEQMKIATSVLSCTAAGKLDRLSSSKDLTMAGRLQYDLEKLQPFLRSKLGSSVTITGRDSRPFRVEGALAPSANRPATVAIGAAASPSGPLTSLTGEAGLSWQAVEAFGSKLGPADLRARLGGGWLRIDPIDTTLNQGKLQLDPNILLEPGPAQLFLTKGTSLQRAKITPELCAGALGYALPIAADVAEADGELSLLLEQGRVPLADPAKADISGRLVVHVARLGPGPLVKELSVLLKGPSTMTLARDLTVPVRLVNGRVYHQDLELRFPELTIRTSGSVGLDGSLALVAEMPVPPKWYGADKLGTALAKQTIRLPMGGTMSRPKLDEQALKTALGQFARDTARDVIKQELEDQLHKLLKPKK